MKKTIFFIVCLMYTATSMQAQIDYTSRITNPSFEDGTTTGWTSYGYNAEDAATVSITPNAQSPYQDRWTMSNADGNYLCDYYLWAWTGWWSYYNIHQTIANLPAGGYELSAILASHSAEVANDGATKYVSLFAGKLDGDMNDANCGIYSNITTIAPLGRAVGVPTKVQFEIDTPTDITIGAGLVNHYSAWEIFFKADNFKLYYLGLPLSNSALELPNDKTTLLTPNQWYYYDADVPAQYILVGKLDDMVYTTSEYDQAIEENPVTHVMQLNAGRIYIKTTRSDATLKISTRLEYQNFKAATLNVDGLPLKLTFLKIYTRDINPDGPGSDGTKLISSYVANKGIDVVAFQEDFNYDTELQSNMSGYKFGTKRASVTSDVIYESNRPIDTDGLQFAVRKAIGSFTNESYTQFNSSYSEDVIDISFTHQNVSLPDGNSLIKKGYRYYETTIGGEKVDVFITHTDAGSTDGSSTDPYVISRQTQLKQIAQAILAKGNTDRPKLFMGDTNCRWTREDLNTNFVNVLSDTYDVGDAWVELTRDGVYPTVEQATIADEVVDKIIYINPKGSKTKKLKPLTYLHDSNGYVNTSGTALGDHAPVIVQFSLYLDGSDAFTIGDIVDNDGMNARDLAALVNILLGNIESNYDLDAADVNGDGYITLADLTMLVNIMPD